MDTCNFVKESEAVNSVNMRQAYPLIVLSICVDKLHGFSDLCVYKLIFFGRFDMAYRDKNFKIKDSLHQETCQLQHLVSKTMLLVTTWP